MKYLPVLFLFLLTTTSLAVTKEDIFVARVIYAEALSCSDEERVLVASVIQGRIGHPGFGSGSLSTMYEVVCQAKAFSCINDPNNKAWKKSATPEKMSAKEKAVYDHCLKLAQGEFEAVEGLVYYHDHSIEKPANWDNRYWKAILRRTTKPFSFYSVQQTKRRS